MGERIIGSIGVVIVGLVPTLLGGWPFVLLMSAVGVAGLRELVVLAIPNAGGRVSSTLPHASRQVHATRCVAQVVALGTTIIAVAVLAAVALRNAPGSVAAGWLAADALAVTAAPHPRGLAWMLLVIAAVWVNDSAAYLVGRSIGRRQLAPTISPNKTVEGALGGLTGAAIAGAAAAQAFGLEIVFPIGAASGLLLGLAGQIGDLAESRLKRWAGVKDSGALIPGHGGVLDRVDALLFALPIGWLLASLIDLNWSAS